MNYKLEQPINGTIAEEKYRCTIEWRNGVIIADEPTANGGQDLGPDPYTLLLSSLASCTLMTLRMYIDKKGWNIPSITVHVNLFQEKDGDKTTTIIDRDLQFGAAISADQRARLMEIAEHCPVTKIITGEVKVRSFVFKVEEQAKTVKYANDELTVFWKPELCQHAKRCWSQLPEVFDYKLKKWINPDGAAAEQIREQVRRCPSGALSFQYNNDSPHP